MRAYALFDFDGTCIRGDSILPFLYYCYRQKHMSLAQLAKSAAAGIAYQLGLRSAEDAKAAALSFLTGKSRQEVQKIGVQFCTQCLVPNLRPEALQTMEQLRKQGCLVLLVTASPAFYLMEMLRHMPIDGILGTELEIDSAGRYSGKMLGRNCRGMEKVARIREYESMCGESLAPEHSAAYGDSASDYPMMQLCARRVGVNPKRKLVRLLQKDACGEVCRWQEPKNGE